MRNALWPLVDKPELAHQSEETSILQFAHELRLQSVGSPGGMA
jgi:hypothetical protein